jgi:hypothetical protein
VRWPPAWELVNWRKSSEPWSNSWRANEVSAEAEESTLLEAVTRKRLVESITG